MEDTEREQAIEQMRGYQEQVAELQCQFMEATSAEELEFSVEEEREMTNLLVEIGQRFTQFSRLESPQTQL